MQDLELVNAFKAAKRYLWAGKTQTVPVLETQFICMASGMAEKYDWITEQARRRAKAIVIKRLEGEFTVADWLVRKGCIARRNRLALTNLQQQQIQEYRHRWLDALIAEFS